MAKHRKTSKVDLGLDRLERLVRIALIIAKVSNVLSDLIDKS